MIKSLIRYGFGVVALGNRKGSISGIEILSGRPEIVGIHTISLYLNPTNQKEYYSYLLSLKPERIIFNPGTYNDELIKIAEQNNIECVLDCALIMISQSRY